MSELDTLVELFNKQLQSIQQEICVEHKEREIKKSTRFQLEKKLIQNCISEIGILYLPGNFLESITGRRIDDKDIPEILEAMNELPEAELKGFNFAYNQITDEGLTVLSQFIQERPLIIHLNLSHNDFTVSGLHTLVTSLIKRPSLQSLKLTGVKVGDEGINSITCLYLSGKGPKDLDVSETDMTMPGFQALCTSFQAVDDDEDYPKFLRRYKLPFTLETMAGWKKENKEYLKSQITTSLCQKGFDASPQKARDNRIQDIFSRMKGNQQIDERNTKQQPQESQSMDEGLDQALDNALFSGGGDGIPLHVIDFGKEAEIASEITEEAKGLPGMDEYMGAYKEIKDTSCSAQGDRPVIVCPSLYSLEADDFNEDSGVDEKETNLKKVNPMYMDTLVEPEPIQVDAPAAEVEILDSLTAEKSAIKFIQKTFHEAGRIAGVSEYSSDSDKAQLLLMTVLENAKRFLQVQTEDTGEDLSLPELKVIWEYSLQTALKIFKPALHLDCQTVEETMAVFVEDFMQIASGTFYKLIQVPFFHDVLENAANKGCADGSADTNEEQPTYSAASSNLSYRDCVERVILKFMEQVILDAGNIIGGGDPSNMRAVEGSAPSDDAKPKTSPGSNQWPSLAEMNEEMVVPLVLQIFEAGGRLAADALAYKEENDAALDEMIEPAKIYLEGIFKKLTNFLQQIKEDELLVEEREKRAPKFCYSTRPVRLVLNRPLFNENEAKMASKLASYLRNNDSVRCLHLRKWGLGEDGTSNLMNDIITNLHIVTLDLGGNGIGSEGMQTIAEYLKKNHNLKHLLLNHNRLRNPGMCVLADAITESSLISLNVAYNDATEIGLNPLLEAVGNSGIYSLFILGNCFSQASCSLLSDLFDSKSLNKADCDAEIQNIDGEKMIAINSQSRDLNEWYEVPVKVDLELVCPPYFNEEYTNIL